MAKATANTSAAGDSFDGKHDGKSTNEAELAEQKEKWEDADFLSFEGTEDKKEESTDQTTPRKNSKRQRGDTNKSFSDNFTSPPPVDLKDQLPPWMDSPHDTRLVHPLTSLHNEIVNFCTVMEPMEEEIQLREDLVTRIRALVEETFGKHLAEVKVFGSQATGLFLPSSDVDIVILMNNNENEDDSKSHEGDGDDGGKNDYQPGTGDAPLQRFASALYEKWLPELSYFELVENTRIPLVKFTHGPTDISVDVCFDTPNGPPAAQLMKTYLDALPPLRPLTFVLKYFLAARGLNEPYTGGVGSFMLQLLIVSFLQHRERDAFNYRRNALGNLGGMLLEFFALYGMEFNYITTGISVQNDGSYFPKGAEDKNDVFWQPTRPFMLALENPLEPTMDVGKSSFRIQIIQRSFAVAYKMLLAHVSAPAEPCVSILATILPPTEEMGKRSALRKQKYGGFLSIPSSPKTSSNKRKKKRKQDKSRNSGQKSPTSLLSTGLSARR